MAENHKHSLEALPPKQNGKQEQENEKLEGEEIKERVSDSPPATESQPPDSPGSYSETPVVHSSVVRGAGLQGSFTAREGGKDESKEPVGLPEMEIIVKDPVEEPQMRTQNQLQVSVCSTPSSELSPTSVSQSLSSAPSPNVPEQKRSSPKVNSVHAGEIKKRTTSGGKTLSSASIVRTSASDGYNWRKYGQKQVKSPGGSRSYYRCTHSDCCAKKIECCDHLGHVIDIVYKSPHSHAPSQKSDSTRENKSTPSNELPVENSVLDQSCRVQNDSDLSPSKEPLQEAPCNADKKRHNSSNGENGKAILKEENVNDPDLKRRVKKGDFTCLDSPVKPGKKPKLVVHAAVDESISGDGYRWRKYGQKMVKGNPHPRNYYRCTSAGCPVRKHIETAVDNSDAVIITYKGVHDHDMPVPKKRHGPPSAPLVAAVAPASKNNSQHEKTDLPQNQKTSTQWSVDTGGELTGEALDLGGEKAMESARTLLSIGFEIGPS